MHRKQDSKLSNKVGRIQNIQLILIITVMQISTIFLKILTAKFKIDTFKPDLKKAKH